jgi:geranylgeranyl diphosphate synthase, type II
MDMNFEKAPDVNVDEYIRMITCKTATLLGCSLQLGAIAAGADARSQDLLYSFGVNMGISFQLMDDLLDAIADPETFGKQPGGDIVANKKTFLFVKAVETANNDQLARLKALSSETNAALKVRDTLALYRELELEKICRNEAEKHTSLALQYIDSLPVPAEKIEALKNFTLALLNREA